MIAISLFFINLSYTQVLSQQDIKEIHNKIKSLDNQYILPGDVGVIETEFGRIIIEFFPNIAPLHAMNFKKLANAGFYNKTTFHRVISDFMIQGGDILSRDSIAYNDGHGGTGYTIQAEFGKSNIRGAVASARKPDAINPKRDSNGSQFYICVSDQSRLDPLGYTVFGKVIEGMDVVDKISLVKTDRGNRPKKNVIMEKVFVTNRETLNLKSLK